MPLHILLQCQLNQPCFKESLPTAYHQQLPFLPLRASLRTPKIAVFPRTRRQSLFLECDSDVGDET